MISPENGVAARVKRMLKNDNIIINHCLSHRLNLGTKDIWNQVKELSGFNSIIHCICWYFSQSYKRINILEEQEEEILGSHLKLIKPLDIRWLSIFKAISRIYEVYPALINALEVIAEQEGCVVAEGLLTRMKSLHFVSHLHIFQDLKSFLEPLNLLFQKQHLKVADAFKEIEITIESLTELTASERLGHFLHCFVSSNQNVSFSTFHNIQLSNLYGYTLESAQNQSKKFHHILLENLKTRFPSQKENLLQS